MSTTPTKFYKGDVVRHDYDEDTVGLDAKPRYVCLETEDWSGLGTMIHLSPKPNGKSTQNKINSSQLTLLRRSDEPETPAHLPAPPEAKSGHHWVYAGNNVGGKRPYACTENGNSQWGQHHPNACGSSCPWLHYLELVPNEPYTPPTE